VHEKSEKSDLFRQKVWYIINTLQANQLFVHSSFLDVKYSAEDEKTPADKSKKTTKKSQVQSKKLPEILTICVLNALVPNSAMLLVGGHGGGKTSIVKYLARLFTGISLSDAEETIIRGHPQLTEEKIIGTLNIKKLMKDGEEEVIWRTFASSFWKIIDEVNRCSAYTQNILLSLLAEGKIKYYDSVLNVHKYCLFATLNPNDVGTFEMSSPFLDRFGISIPISMPKSQDLEIILDSRDEKLGGYDELVQVPQVLTEQQLLNIWFEVSALPCAQDAEDFIHAIIREYTLCERVDKGNSDYLKPSSGLCTGCHFFIPDKVPCCNSDTILSVRVAKDLLRYSRALAWLLDLKEVSVSIIATIAPYVISHRVKYLDRLLNKSPFWGNKYEYTRHLIEIIQKRFTNRMKAYDIIKKLRDAVDVPDAYQIMSTMATNDLIVKQDLLPLAEILANPDYQQIVQTIHDASLKKDVELLASKRKWLLQEMDFPNRGALITKINNILRLLTLSTYNCSMRVWDSIRFTVDGLIPQFTKKLKETTLYKGTYRLRSEDIELEINVTGTQPFDIVNFSFFGGETATDLKKQIENLHGKALKSMDELLEEVRLSQLEAEKALGLPELPKEKPLDSSHDELGDDFFKT
jgi:MoxR-like ATPase